MPTIWGLLDEQQMAALGDDSAYADRGGERRTQRRAVAYLDDPVAALALPRFAGALELNQVRTAGLLLAELEPAVGDLEVGVALAILPQSSAPRARHISSDADGSGSLAFSSMFLRGCCTTVDRSLCDTARSQTARSQSRAAIEGRTRTGTYRSIRRSSRPSAAGTRP
ncbi:MAG TPA: hypothetical protein VMU32_06885 [Solirubrobacteraceae bacterium]|nr:hypothetical protein [Solirubrobacteraceae bacterium]